MNLDEFLARYNNDYDEINFKYKGTENWKTYYEMIREYDLQELTVYSFGIDQFRDLYIEYK